MPAAVAAEVAEQPVEAGLDPQVAMQLAPARRHHVRDVQVADPPAGAGPHLGPVGGHPSVVAQGPLVGAAGSRPRRVVRLPRCAGATSTTLPAAADQERSRPGDRVDGATVDGLHDVADLGADRLRGLRDPALTALPSAGL